MSTKNPSAIKTVDFIPEYGLSGDYKKVSEYNFLEYNSLLMPVVAILFMEKGSNSLIPEMGARDIIAAFPFSTRDEADGLVEDINQQLTNWAAVGCSAYIDDSKSNWSDGDVTLKVDVTGIPAPLTISVNKSGASAKQFKIIPPSVFNKL